MGDSECIVVQRDAGIEEAKGKNMRRRRVQSGAQSAPDSSQGNNEESEYQRTIKNIKQAQNLRS